MSDSRSFHQSCLHPSHYRPVFIWQMFQGSWNYSEVVLWIISFPLFKSSWSSTTPGQLPHKASRSLGSWYFSLSQMLYATPHISEAPGVMKHPEPQKNPQRICPTWHQPISCSIFNHMEDWSRNLLLHPLPQDFMVEKQYHAKSRYSQLFSSWTQLISWKHL